MRAMYRVHTDCMHTFVQHPNGTFASVDEITDLIEQLQYLEYVMRLKNVVQEDFYGTLRGGVEDELFLNSILHYPIADPFVIYRVDQRRLPKIKRYSGVYIIEHASMPGLVKIGQSIDIYERTKVLKHEYHGYVSGVAIFETRNPQRLEASYHQKFAECNEGGEWFHRGPVVDWLDSLLTADLPIRNSHAGVTA